MSNSDHCCVMLPSGKFCKGLHKGKYRHYYKCSNCNVKYCYNHYSQLTYAGKYCKNCFNNDKIKYDNLVANFPTIIKRYPFYIVPNQLLCLLILSKKGLYSDILYSILTILKNNLQSTCYQCKCITIKYSLTLFDNEIRYCSVNNHVLKTMDHCSNNECRHCGQSGLVQSKINPKYWFCKENGCPYTANLEKIIN